MLGMTTKNKIQKQKSRQRQKQKLKAEANLKPTETEARPLVAQGVAVGRLRTIWRVERFAKFAAVHFGFCADQRFDFLWIIVPALQMAATELSLGVFFVACALG